MSRIGVFGGSFNPIHNGHIALAKFLLQQLRLDEVWLVVSPLNPLKKQNTLLPDKLRYKWVEQCLTTEPQLKACDVEMHLPQPSYMWNTLQYLQQQYPQNSFTLLIGADNWSCFHQWFCAQQIIEHFFIAVYPREGYTLDSTTMPAHVQAINAPLFPISSTLVREKIAQREAIDHLVPSPILQDVLKAYSPSTLINR